MSDDAQWRAHLSRKAFLDWLLGTTATGLSLAVLYPVGRFLVPPPAGEAMVGSVTLPFPASELAPNSGRTFNFGGKPALVVRTPSGEIRAFSARCTHLDCTVQYREDLGHIWCACHNGHFDLTGRNIAGPPPSPLPRYEVNQRGEQIVVSRAE